MTKIQKHAIDAQIETAMQTKLRHGYQATAIITATRIGRKSPFLGFRFAVGDDPTHIGHRIDNGDGSISTIVAVC